MTVVGLARTGAAAARWLARIGCAVRVTEAARTPVLEAAARQLKARRVSVELGRHTRGFVWGAELVVLSPGIPLSAPPVRWAGEAGIPVVSELDLASWYCPGQIVAVTGSNGKSTVTTLIGEILQNAGRETVVCGNIGTPFSACLERIRSTTTVVLEVSSFQLETALSFRPAVACLLNVSPNHLDRHRSFCRYLAVKARILEGQFREHWAVLNADDPAVRALEKQARGNVAFFSRRRRLTGAFLKAGRFELALPRSRGVVCRREELRLQGTHNEENALAAAAAAGILGVDPEPIRRVFTAFSGLPHRQQPVAVIRGVTFINDSKATTVTAGLKAIQAAPGRVVLIAGGRDKGSDFRLLRPQARKLKAAVLFGQDGPKIASRLNGSVPLKRAGSLDEAVRLAFSLARAGESVLLSPMCASFDMFENFEARGERFVEAVRGLES